MVLGLVGGATAGAITRRSRAARAGPRARRRSRARRDGPSPWSTPATARRRSSTSRVLAVARRELGRPRGAGSRPGFRRRRRWSCPGACRPAPATTPTPGSCAWPPPTGSRSWSTPSARRSSEAAAAGADIVKPNSGELLASDRPRRRRRGRRRAQTARRQGRGGVARRGRDDRCSPRSGSWRARRCRPPSSATPPAPATPPRRHSSPELAAGAPWPDRLRDAVALSAAAVLQPTAGERRPARRTAGSSPRSSWRSSMPLASTAEILTSAARGGRGVGAFNVVQLEHAEAIVAAAARADAPVILQISENTVRYHGGLEPVALATLHARPAGGGARGASTSTMPSQPELVDEAVRLGFTSVMFDGSRPRLRRRTSPPRRAVVARCHARGVWVEAELGEVGGKDGVHAPGARTDPEEAAQLRGRDRGRRPRRRRRHLARHDPPRTPALDLDLIAAARRARRRAARPARLLRRARRGPGREPSPPGSPR